jgi:predicted lipoprotein with Yx(FWY)xxD motif
MKWMRAITVAATGVALGVVAACGSGGEGARSDNKPAVDEKANNAAAAPADQPAVNNKAAGATSKLGVANAGDLGQIMVDSKGMTIYRFDNDTANPPATNCVGDCATAWPPLLTDDPAAIEVAGVDKALIGSLNRPDGTKQVTIAKWAVYHYSKDTQPGDAKGHGAAGGKWNAIAPTGKKAATATAAKNVAIVAMKVNKLGTVLTDRGGMTLYRFDKDTAKPPKSNCEGDCLKQWPPLLIQDGAQFELNGVDSALVGTVTRSDGTKQVTVNGWPQYYFAGDKAPCDANGQGVGGVWFATNPTGGKAGV